MVEVADISGCANPMRVAVVILEVAIVVVGAVGPGTEDRLVAGYK